MKLDLLLLLFIIKNVNFYLKINFFNDGIFEKSQLTALGLPLPRTTIIEKNFLKIKSDCNRIDEMTITVAPVTNVRNGDGCPSDQLTSLISKIIKCQINISLNKS